MAYVLKLCPNNVAVNMNEMDQDLVYGEIQP